MPLDSGERTGVETKLQAQGRCGVERVLGDIRRAVVGQPFDGMRRLADPKSTLDASYHQVAYHLAGDAGGRWPASP